MQELGPRAQARRRKILDAAELLFGRQGIERTTVDHLIQQASISRATFYRAFSSLDEVIEQLYEEYERQVLERLTADLAQVGSAREVADVIDGVLEDYTQRGATIRAMVREELRPERGMASQHRRVGEQVNIIHNWWERNTQLPADDGLILCLVLLLQSAGLYANGLNQEAFAQLRDALVSVATAVVDRHLSTIQHGYPSAEA